MNRSSTATAIMPSILSRMRLNLSTTQIAELEACTSRLELLLLERGALSQTNVLAMYGGGKDSSHMLFVARYMQLALEERHGTTFRLRVATNRHAGMPTAVMANIDRAYTALGLYGCSNVELLLVNGSSIQVFTPDAAFPEDLLERERLDVLMNGHRCQGDARPTFCNRCNVSMQHAVALAVSHGKEADVVLTGDSPSEQRHYIAWVKRAVLKLEGAAAPRTPGLQRFLQDLEQINQQLTQNVFGAGSAEALERRIAVDAVQHEPVFFSIYRDMAYRAGDHWDLLTGFLGFRFDEIAFSFTESDCGNPGLMAHQNGLRHEHLLGSAYTAGLKEYAGFAIGLMRSKDFPEQLIDEVQRRYGSPEAMAMGRARMEEYARTAYRITEEQLICMLFAPFTEGCRNLHAYLAAEKQNLLPHEAHIRELLGRDKEQDSDRFLGAVLAKLSGLRLVHLRRLFRSGLVLTRQPDRSAGDPFSIILSGDPHKKWIERRTQDGSLIREQLSGR